MREQRASDSQMPFYMFFLWCWHKIFGANEWWLRLARKSHHGFGQIARDKPDAVALLAAHDGTVPPELSDIAFLYLLRLLVEPRRLFPDDLRAERRAAAGGQWKEEGSLQ